MINPPMMNRNHELVSINYYYYDLNANEESGLFIDKSMKISNLFFLNLICNLNFLKYILRSLFNDDNTWLFRIQYIVSYYTYRAIKRLKNYCENNIDMGINLDGFEDIFSILDILFQSKLRNCMMYYGLEN